MRAWLMAICLLAASAQAGIASEPNPLSDAERARMRVAEVTAFFVHKEVPQSLAPIAPRVKAALRKKFIGKADKRPSPEAVEAAGAGNILRVRLIAPITGVTFIQGGSTSTLEGYLLVQDLETGAFLARYGKISVGQRFVGKRTTQIFLARDFAEEAHDLFNEESERKGTRTVEEMAAAYAALYGSGN